MKNKLSILLILSLTLTLQAKADFGFSDGTDFTGEAFYEAVSPDYATRHRTGTSKETVPPLKKLRLKIKNKLDERAVKRLEYAPTAPQEENKFVKEEKSKSEYASEETEDNFQEMTPDGFETDESAVVENNKRKSLFNRKTKNNESEIAEDNIILDCDNVDYDTQNYLIKAKNNVVVTFVKQDTVVKCDDMTFDRINNTIKAEGNVRVYKSGRTITGDYIFVDLNEENALIENPLSMSESIEIHSRKGYVYGDKITQTDGEMSIVDSHPIHFRSSRRGPRTNSMLVPPHDTLTEDLEKGLIKFEADSIKIKQKGDLEVIAIRKGRMKRGDRTIFKVPAVKIYTNKNHDYAETNMWEIGYYRGMGLFTGPGWVFELPKGSVLKAMPVVNFNDKFGIGAVGRFSSGTNQTIATYNTVADRAIVYGRQRLDDRLSLQYGVNSYMDEWFLGRRRPKYGVSAIYSNTFSSNGFLIPNQDSMLAHRLEAGYFHDRDFDSHFHKLKNGGTMGTSRFRYMIMAQQYLLSLKDPEGMKSFSVRLISQLSTALYGTGDTQVVARVAPVVTVQYKRWMQDMGYYFSAIDDNTPLRNYDRYRYGKQYIYFREYFRICKWLTVSWFAYINTTNDAPNKRRFQENTFYFSFGPEDFKFHVGYDFERAIMRAAFEVMMDAKGTNVKYNTFEITQDKKAKKEITPTQRKFEENAAPTQPKVLQRAVVENVKVVDDVL